MTTPRMKPPKMAWMPTASIRKAETQKASRTRASTVVLISPSRSTMRPSGARIFGPRIVTNATQARPPPMASTATPGPPPKVASTTASTHHETASSKAPAVRDRVPSEVLARPRSLMIRASIGKAVRAMQAPMNRVALALGDGRGEQARDLQQERRDQGGDQERRGDAGERHAHGALGLGLEVVGLEGGADHEHVEAHAQLGADIEDVLGLLGEQRQLEVGEQQAQQGRAQHHAGDHLAHHLRLGQELLAQPADHAAGQEDHGQLQEEVHAEVAGRVAVGGDLGGRAVRREDAGRRADEAGNDVGHCLSPLLNPLGVDRR
jgi:hypothetical protein